MTGKNEEGAEEAQKSLPGKVEIKLQFPVEFGDDTITHVTLRRPKGKDMKGLRNIKDSHDDQLKLISRLMGQPTSFVDELDFVDLQKIMESTMDFLPDGP